MRRPSEPDGPLQRASSSAGREGRAAPVVLSLALLALTSVHSASGSPGELGATAVDLAEAASPDRYLDGPPSGHTGGFGEPDCTACHFDAPVNPDEGVLRLQGIPDRYAPGEAYELRVVLEAPDRGRGGFQLSARFGKGALRGASAGTLAPADSTAQVVGGDAGGGSESEDPAVQYAQHTEKGTGDAARASADSYAWTVRWTAPEEAEAPVLFHASANAANGDASEFGDRVFTVEARAKPCEAAGAPAGDPRPEGDPRPARPDGG